MQCSKRKLSFCEWLTDVLDRQRCRPENAHWIDRDEGVFELRWLNARSSSWTPEDGELFELWRMEGSRCCRDKEALVHKNMKTNFRMNLASRSKFEELTKLRETKGENAKRCYRIVKAKTPTKLPDDENEDWIPIGDWPYFLPPEISPEPEVFTSVESPLGSGTCTMQDPTFFELLKNGESNNTHPNENIVNPIESHSNVSNFSPHSSSAWSTNGTWDNLACPDSWENLSPTYGVCLNQDCNSFAENWNQFNPNCSQATLRLT